MQNLLRIACFTQNYPPLADSEAYVTAKWVDAMREAGHEVVVFRGGSTSAGRANAARLIWMVIRHFWRINRLRTLELTMVDRLHLFVEDSIREFLEEHRTKPFHLLTSRYEPVGSAIAAYWCKNISQLPWIASYNDPLPRVTAPRRRLAGYLDRHRNNFQRRWTKDLLRTPDALVFPCEQLRRHVLDLTYPDKSTRDVLPTQVVIPHIGGGGSSSPRSCTQPRPSGATPILRHIGYLSAARSTSTLLEALRLWDASAACGPLKLEFIGRAVGQEKLLAACRPGSFAKVEISVRPEVSQSEAIKMMKEATGTILIESPSKESIFLPSKFCDYAASGCPILAITAQDSEVTRYIRECGGGIAVPHTDPQAIFSGLHKIVSGNLKASPILAARFSPSQITQQWAAITDEVLSRTQHHCLKQTT